MKVIVLVCMCLGLGSAARAQLTDLQAGRNFPQSLTTFGAFHSENIDAADVDNDGDYDVGVANGGDTSSGQLNRLFMNLGGSAGGTLGSFADETATRFAGAPADTSRDLEFADFENDGDFDLFVSNRGNSGLGGSVSRAYMNQGGFQAGTIGFFSESTDDFWGTLVDVSPTQEVGVVDGHGPFRAFSCDCDFGDLDKDGDLDLFFSTYGPNLNGTSNSRVFLNDGEARFDELWPWVEPGADIMLHTLDVDLADLDGDFDLDIVGSSRDSQTRVYRNNLSGPGGATAMFTDMTQTALLDTGAAQEGNFNTYETEVGDLDGDGDFDLLMVNYGGPSGLLERILRNDGDFSFSKQDGWIQGDPNVDENEADFLDFDSDGDLDIFVANFSGTNTLFASGVAQNLDPAAGLFFRTGALHLGVELPQVGNGGTSMDGECADLDNDGDPDILVANNFGGLNTYYENALGVPDTFAPTFAALSEPLDKTDGSDTAIYAAVRDNAPISIVNQYSAKLFYSLDAGQLRCVLMASQGGMQFRAEIPGEHVGEIDFHVEVTDDAGNTASSPVISYTQSGGSPGGWQSLSCGTPGAAGVPYLDGRGDLSPGADTRFVLRDAAPTAFSLLFVSTSSTPVPFKQGTLYAFPIQLSINRPTDSGGLANLGFAWPALSSLPAGSEVFAQFAVQDAAHPSGVALSNGVLATVP